MLTHLLTNNTETPLGIDTPRPHLSWQIAPQQVARGLRQSACQIQAAASPEDLASASFLWDSGKLLSPHNIGIPYNGPELHSGQRVFWRARIWDSQDTPSSWSEPTWFEMGLLQPADWRADWVGFPAGLSGKALYFRGEFQLEKPLASARLYAVALGYGEFHINGQVLDARVLDPAPTTYDRRVLYSTYDVTALLQPGKNVVGVIAGAGWYGIPKLLLQLRADCTDGSTTWLVTGRHGQGGTGWRAGQGPVQSNSIYDGEVYDARLEYPFWDRPIPEDQSTAEPAGRKLFQSWGTAMVVEPPGGQLTAQSLEPMGVVATLPPRQVRAVSPGVHVFDFGQNMAGWALLKVQGQRGTTITLRFAETLYEDGAVNQENLRTARATDEYILKGGQAELWEPRFTYHGFRYVQIEGLPEDPQPDTLQARVVRSSVPAVGDFACDQDLLNRISLAARWTEASNLHGIPTDCPQRDERMGWMNDLAARTEEALCNFNLVRLFAKFITDIEDAQEPSGAIPDTVPYRWGGRPADPVSAAYLLIPWQLYRWYGDTRTLADRFNGMKAWVDYLASRSVDGILGYSYYGDWAPPVDEALGGREGGSALSAHTPGELVSTAYLAYCARLLSQIATVLAKTQEASHYAALSDSTAAAFHQRFYDEAAGGYGSNNQSCNTISLYMGLVPPELRQRVFHSLIANIEARDFHLSTGNLCTKYLLEVLSDFGLGDVALRIAAQTTYPSWGYMLANGATTIWERWEKATGSGMNSHNHPMLASVGSWLVKYAAGLDQQPDSVAFNRIKIHPRAHGLKWARASLQTVQGRASVEWRLQENEFHLSAEIPPNTRARIYLPLPDPSAHPWLYESDQVIWEPGGIFHPVQGLEAAQIEQGHLVVDVLSGAYSFRLLKP